MSADILSRIVERVSCEQCLAARSQIHEPRAHVGGVTRDEHLIRIVPLDHHRLTDMNADARGY